MTEEEATELVERIYARFPRAFLSEGARAAWSGAFLPFGKDPTVEAIAHAVKSWDGQHPPPLNGLRKLAERKHAELHPPPKEEPEIPNATLRDSASTAIHRKYLRIIDHLWRHAHSHRWTGNDAKFHAGNRDRIERRLNEKYGNGWFYEEQWDMDNEGNLARRNDVLS